MMQYLFQIIVLGFTAYLWWLARRDLVRRSEEVYGPAAQEWEQLQQAVQTLIADLERRATEAEQRVAAAERRIAGFSGQDLAPAPSVPSPVQESTEPPTPATQDLLAAERAPYLNTEQAAHEERYAPVYALIESGVTDAVEIARRTGLGQGEVALLLGLRTRQPIR